MTLDSLRSLLEKPAPPGGRRYVRASVDLKTEKRGIRRHIWLNASEIRDALARDLIIKCHEVLVSEVNLEHKRQWQKLRNKVLRLYGRQCMRCTETEERLELDHIKPWETFP